MFLPLWRSEFRKRNCAIFDCVAKARFQATSGEDCTIGHRPQTAGSGVFFVFFFPSFRLRFRYRHRFRYRRLRSLQTLKGFARNPYSFCRKPLRVLGLTLEGFLCRRRSIFPDCALLHDE